MRSQKLVEKPEHSLRILFGLWLEELGLLWVNCLEFLLGRRINEVAWHEVVHLFGRISNRPELNEEHDRIEASIDCFSNWNNAKDEQWQHQCPLHPQRASFRLKCEYVLKRLLNHEGIEEDPGSWPKDVHNRCELQPVHVHNERQVSLIIRQHL